jgi:hypothetical protein
MRGRSRVTGPYTSNLPNDSEIAWVRNGETPKTVWVYVRSRKFKPVPEGAEPPIFDLMFEFEEVEEIE